MPRKLEIWLAIGLLLVCSPVHSDDDLIQRVRADGLKQWSQMESKCKNLQGKFRLVEEHSKISAPKEIIKKKETLVWFWNDGDHALTKLQKRTWVNN